MSVQHTSFLPAAELQDFFATYVIQEVPDEVTEPFFTAALGMSGFIITLAHLSGILNAKINGDNFFTDHAVATGQVTAPIYGKLICKLKAMLVFFKPTGKQRFFGNDLSELTNTAKKSVMHAFANQSRNNSEVKL